MNLMQRIKHAGRMLFKGAGTERELSLTSTSGWPQLRPGAPINDDTALQISTVWACSRLISEVLAVVPCSVFERDGRNAVERPDHALAEVLRRPNADMDSTNLTEALGLNLCLRGNAYHLKGFVGKRLVSLYPMPAHLVTPKRNDKTGDIVYEFNDRGRIETYPRDQVWHVRGFGPTGLAGLSPIGVQRQSLAFVSQAATTGNAVLENASMPSVFVKIAEWLKDDQRKKSVQKIREEYSGAVNAGKPWFLEGGMTAEVQHVNLEDLQFLETRRFGVQEICRIYRVPPHMVADLDRATFSNIEQMSQEMLTYTFLPYWRRIETAANRWLLAAGEASRFFVRFNVEGLLRADSAARALFYSAMLQNGVYSRNEVRGLENRNPVDGLDDYTVQSNMLPVAQLMPLVDALIASKYGGSNPVNAPNQGIPK